MGLCSEPPGGLSLPSWCLSSDAKSQIFIAGTWLSPDLYLKRPPRLHPYSRVDRLLESKAKEGVHIYLLLFREPDTMTIDSDYTKFRFNNLHHEGHIHVSRWPPPPALAPEKSMGPCGFCADVLSLVAPPMVQLLRHGDGRFPHNWCHHEKLLCIDQELAFVGSHDLGLGQYDTEDHLLRDDDKEIIWPSKDYSNPRVKDFIDVHDQGALPGHDR